MAKRVLVLPRDSFAFVGAERSSLYTALLYAFGEANDRLVTSLAIDDIRTHLVFVDWHTPVADTELTAALTQLVEWDLVTVGQNHAEHYRTAVEYERRNLQYALTRKGEASLAGYMAAVTAMESAGVLQTAVLEAIADTLERLASVCADLPGVAGEPQHSRQEATATERSVFARLQELDAHLTSLRGGVRAYNGDLQRLLRAEEVDDGIFIEVKEATVRYLDEFVSRLDERAERIRSATERVRSTGTAQMFRAALAGAEQPPHPDAAARDERWLLQAQARWSGLEAWFAPVGGGVPRVRQLGSTAQHAIVTLLQVVDRMRASRRRPSSMQADLRQLARLFAKAPSEDDLHRIWRATCGLHAARHAHLGHEDPDLVSRNATWAQAAPVPVSILLRESGMTQKQARPPRVRDVSELRRRRAEQARLDRSAVDEALRAFGTDHPLRLSELGTLEGATFEVLLDLLGRAVATRPRAGVWHVTSGDGRVTMTVGAPEDGQRALITTARGTLDAPDYLVTIAAVQPERALALVHAAAGQGAV